MILSELGVDHITSGSAHPQEKKKGTSMEWCGFHGKLCRGSCGYKPPIHISKCTKKLSVSLTRIVLAPGHLLSALN